MFIQNRDDAKQFFIRKIAEQAQREKIKLSDIELKMLLWTELYPIPGLTPDELSKLNGQFEAECDSDEYEAKISDLLQSAYERDISSGVGGEDWKTAHELLSKEDHYILVMIDQALGSKLKKKRLLGLF